MITMRSKRYSIQAMAATPLDNPEDNMGAQAVKTKHKLADQRKIIPMKTSEHKDCSTIHLHKQFIFTKIIKNQIK